MVVAVVVVMYNSAYLLPALVDSLPSGLGGLDWNLTFVDNASPDDSIEVARRTAPWAKVVETGRNGGYAAGINAGVEAAEPADAYLVLNPDVRLAGGCGSALYEGLRHPSTGITVPRLTDAKGSLAHSMRREPSLVRALSDAVFGATRAGRIGAIGEVVGLDALYRDEQFSDWAEGAVLMISAACMRATQGWDESFFMYSEEVDFALRARDLGFRTRYLPSAEAVHLRGGSATDPRLWPLVVRNRIVAYSRRHSRLKASLYYAVVLLRELTRAILGQPTSRASLRLLLDPRRFRAEPGPWSITGGTRP